MDIEGQRSKEDQPSVGFPDICFAIEDFDVAFKGLVSMPPQVFLNSMGCSLADAVSLPNHCLPCKQYSGAFNSCPHALMPSSKWCKHSCVCNRHDLEVRHYSVDMLKC